MNCVKVLLARGADWKTKDNEGQTPVHVCTRHKSAKCLALLLKYTEPGAIDDQDANKVTISGYQVVKYMCLIVVEIICPLIAY